MVTQMVYKVGETIFLEILFRQTDEAVHQLKDLIGVGLERGDNDQDGKMDNDTIARAFQTLLRQIQASL